MVGSITTSYGDNKLKEDKPTVELSTEYKPIKAGGVSKKKKKKVVVPIIKQETKSMIEIISPDIIHQLAKSKGWWEEGRKIPELLMLCVSELSEALEAYRNKIPYGQKGCFAEEIADTVIRLWDLSAALGIDIAWEVNKKHQINMERPYRHGGKVC